MNITNKDKLFIVFGVIILALYFSGNFSDLFDSFLSIVRTGDTAVISVPFNAEKATLNLPYGPSGISRTVDYRQATYTLSPLPSTLKFEAGDHIIELHYDIGSTESVSGKLPGGTIYNGYVLHDFSASVDGFPAGVMYLESNDQLKPISAFSYECQLCCPLSLCYGELPLGYYPQFDDDKDGFEHRPVIFNIPKIVIVSDMDYIPSVVLDFEVSNILANPDADHRTTKVVNPLVSATAFVLDEWLNPNVITCASLGGQCCSSGGEGSLSTASDCDCYTSCVVPSTWDEASYQDNSCSRQEGSVVMSKTFTGGSRLSLEIIENGRSIIGRRIDSFCRSMPTIIQNTDSNVVSKDFTGEIYKDLVAHNTVTVPQNAVYKLFFISTDIEDLQLTCEDGSVLNLDDVPSCVPLPGFVETCNGVFDFETGTCITQTESVCPEGEVLVTQGDASYCIDDEVFVDSDTVQDYIDSGRATPAKEIPTTNVSQPTSFDTYNIDSTTIFILIMVGIITLWLIKQKH